MHPDWLKRFIRARNDPFKQKKISSMFKKSDKKFTMIADVEDIGGGHRFAFDFCTRIRVVVYTVASFITMHNDVVHV